MATLGEMLGLGGAGAPPVEEEQRYPFAPSNLPMQPQAAPSGAPDVGASLETDLASLTAEADEHLLNRRARQRREAQNRFDGVKTYG